MRKHTFAQGKPLLLKLAEKGLEFDQLLQRELEVSASNPDIEPEDDGFPDSYLTLALYRLNTTLTRVGDQYAKQGKVRRHGGGGEGATPGLYPDLEVVTYDDVLAHARRRLTLIRMIRRAAR